jgi:hypothetical protein
MTTQEEKMRRISILERAISERGWSLQIKRAMANEFGVTTRTIDRYREELIQGYRQEMSEDELDFKRAEFIGRLRGHQRAALGSGRLGPLASMLNLEARISGLEQAESGQGSGQVQVLLNVPDVFKSETD